MEMNENPFEDIINLYTLIESIDQRRKDIDKRVDMLEKRKHILGDKIGKLEDNNVPLSTIVMKLLNQLIEQTKKRKELFEKWRESGTLRNLIISNAEKMEKQLIATKATSFTTQQKEKIELLIVQLEQVAARQKRILDKREDIMTEEDRIVTEIEKKI